MLRCAVRGRGRMGRGSRIHRRRRAVSSGDFRRGDPEWLVSVSEFVIRKNVVVEHAGLIVVIEDILATP